MCVWRFICCSYISRATGSVNNHRVQGNVTAVKLIAPHLLGGLKSLWCSRATELQHMGKYLQWAPSMGEFTAGTFQKEEEVSFFDLYHGDKYRRWFIVGAPLAPFEMPGGGSAGSHSNTEPYFLPLPAWIQTRAHPHWDQFGVFTLSRTESLQESGRRI